MNHKTQILNSGILVVLLSLSLSGCVPLILGAAAGAGGVVYVKGNLQRNLDESLEDVYDATLKALKKEGYFVILDEVNRFDAKIKAEDEIGKDVTVSMKALTEKASSINIRFGLIGDKDRSTIIMNAIEEEL